MRLFVALFLIFCCFESYAQEFSELEKKRIQWKDTYMKSAKDQLATFETMDGISDFSDSIQRLYYVDTFVVNRIYEDMITYDGTTLGINQANIYSAGDYEVLIEKYIAIISRKLLPEDKVKFEAANVAWKAYYQKQKELVGALMQPIYNGGGTIQTIIYSGRLKDLQRVRLQELMDLLKDFV